MAIYTYIASQNPSQRPLAVVLALVSAIILSPLYNAGRRNENTRSYFETKLSSGFVLPVVLSGLIIAIRTVSSPSRMRGSAIDPSVEASCVLRIGGSSWGLAGVLLTLLFVLSWRHSVRDFFWR